MKCRKRRGNCVLQILGIAEVAVTAAGGRGCNCCFSERRRWLNEDKVVYLRGPK